MRIIISPYSKKMRNGENNPKNYPYWASVANGLKELGHHVIQVGLVGESEIVLDHRFGLSLDYLKRLIEDCDLWVSVDNFFPHLASHTSKPGVVLFGKSDPNIFGYKRNLNLLKDRKYLREKQFDIWESEKFDSECFLSPDEVIKAIMKFKEKK